MTCDEAQELITALVDGELPGPERALAESHLHDCARCRLALEAERALKQAIRGTGERMRAPAALRERILADPRVFPAQSRAAARWRDLLWPMPRALQGALAVAILLVIALPGYFSLDHGSEPIAVASLETYDLFLRGKLPLRRAENAAELEAQLSHAVGDRFRPMGYDFSAMDLRPVAGLVREIQGRKVLVVVYQGPHGDLLCYTFLGSEDDAPPHAAKFFHAAKKMNLYAFSRGGVNAVLHREGEVICILASPMPMEELLAVTRSKARPS